MHIMVDIETLSTRMDAAILSIGAVRFTPHRIEPYSFYNVVGLAGNTSLGRHIDANTLAWWMDQSPGAREVLRGTGAVHLSEALVAFGTWVRGAAGPDKEEVYVWANGPNFDLSILEHAYAQHTYPAPWNFRNVRCMRTLRSLVGADLVQRTEPHCPHNALDDARAQAEWVQNAWRAGIGLARDNA